LLFAGFPYSKATWRKYSTIQGAPHRFEFQQDTKVFLPPKDFESVIGEKKKSQ
jgi:hypothetical protein